MMCCILQCANHGTLNICLNWNHILHSKTICCHTIILILSLHANSLITWPLASERTFSGRATMRRNAIHNFLFKPGGHMTFWCLEVVPVVYTRVLHVDIHITPACGMCLESTGTLHVNCCMEPCQSTQTDQTWSPLQTVDHGSQVLSVPNPANTLTTQPDYLTA